MRKITFGDIKIGQTARNHIDDCLNSNQITMGDKVRLFEEKWAALFGYKYAKAVSCGTTADLSAYLSLYDLGAKRGDEIIVPALCFIAVANAVLAAGFTPVFCDINRYTLNLDETKVEKHITDKTRAIVAVNTMGKPCKMDVLRNICTFHKILLISDNCEGHGCTYQSKFMGKWADVCTYSCYVAHLVVGGELGAVCTNRDDIADSVHSTRTHGRRNGDLFFNHERFGWNSKPTNIHCSIALEGIEKFWETFHTRRDNVKYLSYALRGISDRAYFNLEEDSDVNCPHAFSIVLREDNEEQFISFYKYLEENGVQCKVNFKSIPTQQKSFEWMGYKLGEFPEAEFVGRNGLHFGCHQYLTREDLDYACEVINKWFNVAN